MAELFADVVGQDRAVAELRAAAAKPVHAYLLVGPPGTGKRSAARSFAAALLCPAGGDGTCETCRRVLEGAHPDVIVKERQGARITVEDAREITRVASRSPVEASRKVVVLADFHLAADVAPALLKTIEEPPPTSIFVVLAELIPPELITIASRCVTVEFGPLAPERVAAVLVGEGVDAAVAAEAAAGSGGRLDRARLLASDPGFAARRAAWAAVPDRLDGTGATVVAVVDELQAALDAAVEPLRARHLTERELLEERARVSGERGLGRKDLDDRHKREERRLRTDELRSGLATLAGAYRDRLARSTGQEATSVAALSAISAMNEALVRNPNEVLQLEALLLKIGPAA
jgi:DNA polymerase-3 subunit delta'